MLGILCEKPSQMRNFAKALGGQRGSYAGETYVLTCARGHLFEFKDPAKMVSPALSERYKSWDVKNLPWDEHDFDWSYERREGVSASDLNNIKGVLGKCDTVVIATDNDPTGEGQLLAWEVIDQLQLTPRNGFERMYFADESAKSIQKAFRNRVKLPAMVDDPEYRKAFFRARWDYISMSWTRCATKLANGNLLLRQGRLKSAMTLLVGMQLDAVKNYVKKPFFQNRFRDENGVVYVNEEEPRFDKKEDVPSDYHASDVVCDSKTSKSRKPPRLIDLSTLGGRLASKGLKSDQILRVAQSLYESSILSYPRTEDVCVTAEQFNELLPLTDQICKVVGVDPSIITHRTPRKSHVKEGMAHGANRPGLIVPKSLADLDKEFGKGASMIYELVAKSWLMMLAEDYEYEAQVGHVKDYPKFVGKANVPKSLGWRAVDAGAADEDEDESSGLGKTAEPFVYEGANPKPQAPTVKWLMTRLASLSIGTGATRLSVLNDVTRKSKSQLFEDKRGRLSFATCGEMSYLMLPGTHIGDLGVTKHVQDQMKGIAEGKLDPEECLHEIQQMVREDIETMRENGKKMRERLNIRTTDPSDVVEAEFQGKKIRFKRVWCGHRFTDDELSDLLAGKTIKVCHLKSKSGNEFGAEGRLSQLEYNGRKYWGFDRTKFLNADGSESEAMNEDNYATGKWKGKQVRFKRIWGGHRFTDEEVADLLAGKTIKVLGLKSKSGKEYGVEGKLANLKYQGRAYVGFDKTGFVDADGTARKVADDKDYARGTWNGQEVRFKRIFRGYRMTDAEVKKLLAGKKVNVKGLKAKSGREYGVSTQLAWKEFNGRKYVGIDQVDFL